MSDDEKLYQELCEKFEEHVERFEQHELNEADKFDRLIEAQQTNTNAISQVTTALSTLVEDTGAIVRLHKDFQGAARVGKGVQGFMLWLLKWGAIGIGIYTGITWVVDHFQN